MICPNCKKDNFADHENSGAKFKICKECGYIIQTQQSDEFDKACEEQEKLREQSSIPIVECPYCHSTNTKKISTMSKATHTAMFGVFSMSRNSKQFHCNNCKADF